MLGVARGSIPWCPVRPHLNMNLRAVLNYSDVYGFPNGGRLRRVMDALPPAILTVPPHLGAKWVPFKLHQTSEVIESGGSTRFSARAAQRTLHVLFTAVVAVGNHEHAAPVRILRRDVINSGQVAPGCENVRARLNQF
jgi:hypothetical protein